MDLFSSDEPEDDNDDFESEIATAVDAQAQETFSHPRQGKFITGHENIEKRLLQLASGSHMPHALIFAGPKGIGKATMAYRLARFLFKQGIRDSNQGGLFGDAPTVPDSLNISASDPVFARVASGGHADLMTIERAYDAGKDKYKASVEVDEVRKVAPFLRRTAAEEGWRVVIIDDADTMNRNAQNALLKILEEPPPHVLLILIAHRPGALIPTIRSRAQLVTFESLNDDTLKALLKQQGEVLSPEEFSTLSGLAQGSFGAARRILETEGLQMTGRILDLLQNYPDFDRVEIHTFADSIVLSDQKSEVTAEIMPALFRHMARAMARGIEIRGLGVHRAVMEALMERSSLQKLLETAEALQAHFTRTAFANLDKRQGILTAFSLIQ